jgi:hypothetical protein
MVMYSSRSNLLDFGRARTAAAIRKRDTLARQAEPVVIDDTHATRVVAKRNRVRK